MEYNRSINQLTGAIVDVYLLSKTKYLLGSPWSSFTEFALRLGCPYVKFPGKDFAKRMYGAMIYNNSCNLGDNIQTLAALQFITKKVNINDIYWVDRDILNSGIYDIKGNKIYDIIDFPYSLQLIMNGWYDGRLTHWPLNYKLIPYLTSFHINETEFILKDPKFDKLKTEMVQSSFFDSETKINYFIENSPIGCRDEHTLKLFQKHNIPAYHSCCLTLTLKRNPDIVKTDKILIVDTHILFPKMMKQKVPANIRKKALYRSQGMVTTRPNDEKMDMAKKLLDEYQECKYVITSRLHCALPCLAFGIPVIFIFDDIIKDIRFDQTIYKILGLDSNGNLPENIDWENPIITEEQKSTINSIKDSFEKRVEKFLE